MNNRERKFQALFLYHSRKISLSELKALFRVGSVAASNEYSSSRNQKNVLATQARLEKLERLASTRSEAKQRALLKLAPKRKNPSDRGTAISAFVTGWRGPRTFERFSPMPPHRNSTPRPGSSKGKIEATRYEGWEQFNKRFDALMRELERLLAGGGKLPSAALKGLRDRVRISAKAR